MELHAFLRYLVMAVITSVNSQGIRSTDRREIAFLFFLRHRMDIILQQETHWTRDMETQIQREWNGGVFFNHGTITVRGVAILIHPRLENTVGHNRSDNEGRILNIVLTLDDHTFNIINIYAPQTDTVRRAFFSSLDGFLSKDFDNIIGGDYNCISNARLDTVGGNLNARQFPATFFLEFVHNIIYLTFGVIDIRKSDTSLGLGGIPPMEQLYVDGLTTLYTSLFWMHRLSLFHILTQPRPQDLLLDDFQNSGSSGEDPGTQQKLRDLFVHGGWKFIQYGGQDKE